MTAFREEWTQIKRSLPGRRFRNWYRRCRAAERGRSVYRRALHVTVGILIVLAGVVMLVTPGPGWLTIGLGAALLARESLLVARLLDWIELSGRRLARSAYRRWRAASPGGRAAAVAIPTAAVAAVGYFIARQLLVLF